MILCRVFDHIPHTHPPLSYHSCTDYTVHSSSTSAPYLFDSHCRGCKCHDYSIHQIHRQRLLVSGDPRSETFPRILLTSDYSTRRGFCDLQPSLSHPCCRDIVVSGGLILILDHRPSVKINWHRWLRRTILGWTERRLRQAGSCLRSNCSNGHCVG